MKMNGLASLSLALLLCLAPASAFSAVAVDNIGLTLSPNVTYYNGATQLFGFTAGITTGDLQSSATPTPGYYDYQILNAQLIFTMVPRVSDNSSGGIASGDFKGGATVTLTGNLKDKTSGTNVYANAVTLLVADMVIPSGQTWVLQEQASFVMAAIYFDVVGGELHNGSLFDMDEFRLAFSAMPIPNPTSFAASQTSLVTRIEMVSIPEPATLAVLGLGGLLLRKRLA